MKSINFLTSAAEQYALSAEDLQEFKNAMRGAVYSVDDGPYHERRAVWNGMIDRKPSLIACCSGTADVAAAVKFARKHNLHFSIRSGGHHVTGKAVCDQGLMIDLSDMRQVFVDPYKRTAIVGGGATLGDVDHETQLHGLAAPLGAVSATGVAGLTLHGGYGHLARRFGMSSDNLLSAQVVTAEGIVVRASADRNEDLYWALRGGGGNFGIVTSMEFQLHPVGPHIWLLFTIFPFDDGKKGLQLLRDQMQHAPDELMMLAVFWNAPNEDFIPREYRGKPVFIFYGNYSGTQERGEKILEPFRTMSAPVADLSGRMPYEDIQRLLDADYPDGRHYYWKSVYLDELDDNAIDFIMAQAAARPSGISSLDVWTLGGKINRIDPSATAFSQRRAKFMVGIESNWDNPVDADANISWAKDVYSGLQKDNTTGLYLNFPGFGEEGRDILKKSYGPNYERLRQVKAKWDPDNFFKGFIEL